MSRFHSYINSAKDILSIYKGEEPLSSFLKKYFSANKKYGSKDRKQIAHLCYCFFRLGKAIMNMSMEEKLLMSEFLCADKPSEILASLKPEWNEKYGLPVREKLSTINYSFSIFDVFPWKEELSEGIDHENFCFSFLIQPNLFLRLRPRREKIVQEKLLKSGIDFRIVTDTCLALANASKIDEIIELDIEAVVQDQNSQRTAEFIKSEISHFKSEISVWDCCAGSGGKSIMTFDLDPKIKFAVSDTRESILATLKNRFANAGIKSYKNFIADLSQAKSEIKNLKPEIIIADVPCSGSGTWSRTPEQLYFFEESEIGRYAALQKKIVSNAIPHLKPGGSFIYITCSVFRKENEEVVTFIKENFQLKLKNMEILKGYDKKADSMFVAVLGEEL
ncbi:MAG TPA: Fmu (Sun) domain-containing protein [Chitinophagaceae bacterium]|nr:Fmu (Sun) domain-containing protein [Chitinophagaceae bacterium]